MAWGPEARRSLLGWKADYLIMAASNQIINVFNTNALQNQIPVDQNVLSPFNVVFFSNKTTKSESLKKSAFHTAEIS